jgi:hypothetical protein
MQPYPRSSVRIHDMQSDDYRLSILVAQLLRIERQQQSPHVTVDSPICNCLHSNPKQTFSYNLISVET